MDLLQQLRINRQIMALIDEKYQDNPGWRNVDSTESRYYGRLALDAQKAHDLLNAQLKETATHG